jgi:dCMP deaminase
MKKILLAFVPAIHAGYMKTISRNEVEEVWLLTWEAVIELAGASENRQYLLRSFEHRIPIEYVQTVFREMYPLHQKDLVTCIESLSALKDKIEHMQSSCSLLLPSEDITEYLIEDGCLSRASYRVVSDIFLRWSKGVPQKESLPRVVTLKESVFFDDVVASAQHNASLSSDQWRNVGAVLFDSSGKIVATGYNKHLPIGHHDEVFGDARASFDRGEHPDIVSSVHAEQYALTELLRAGISTKGLSLFTTVYPCPVCTKLICLSGIRKVFFKEGYSVMTSAWDLMQVYGVTVVQLV